MILDLRKNGFGLTYGQRMPEELIDQEVWFDNAPTEFQKLLDQQAIVYMGEPGAGKSHISQDIFNLGLANDMACLMVACHINSNNLRGREATASSLNDARSAKQEAIVMFDNFDFAVYTGSVRRRKTNRQVQEYCEFVTASVLDCLDAGCHVLATTHDDGYRSNHSAANQSTFDMFNDCIEELGGSTEFTGNLTKENAIRILVNRGIDLNLADIIAGELELNEALCFRQAYHINPELFIKEGATSAIAVVDKLKQDKISGGA